jgi:hypothetical protein
MAFPVGIGPLLHTCSRGGLAAGVSLYEAQCIAFRRDAVNAGHPGSCGGA